MGTLGSAGRFLRAPKTREPSAVTGYNTHLRQVEGKGMRVTGQAWYKQLWVQVLIAMAAGILLGKLRPELGARMQPLGDAFIKTIRMLIAPIIFCTVVHGVARMADMARVGRMALKAIVYFEVLTTIALVVGLIAVNVLQPGAGMNVDLSRVDASSVTPYATQTQSETPTQFLTNIIPQTLVGAFAEGSVLQV